MDDRGGAPEAPVAATASSGGDVTAGPEAAFEALRYAVSHDLSAPVRHIVAFSNMLQQRLGDSLEGPDAELLQRLSGAAGRLDQMLTGMIEHARMLKRSAELTSVDVDKLIDGVVRRRRAGIDTDPLPADTTVEVVATTGAPVTSDPDLLQLILTNLVANAVEAGREGEANRVEVGARLEGGALVLEVADTGTGMDPAHLDRAVKLFGRLVTASQRPGTGVGLTLAQDAVDLLGGSLAYAPVDPHGSRFTVTLGDDAP